MTSGWYERILHVFSKWKTRDFTSYKNRCLWRVCLGLDAGVDYSKIDEDSNLDDLNLENRENEERYFDEDDPDE